MTPDIKKRLMPLNEAERSSLKYMLSIPSATIPKINLISRGHFLLFLNSSCKRSSSCRYKGKLR